MAAPLLTPDLEALLRMGLAVLCGLAVGRNRAHHGSTPHPNRLRVHVLVGLSACLMVLAAGADEQARSRAIQGVAAGVGFLGAGEILVPSRGSKKRPVEVRGLSSAASIWFTASLGVTVAASSPVLGLVALALALVTLSDGHEGDAGGATPVGPGSGASVARNGGAGLEAGGTETPQGDGTAAQAAGASEAVEQQAARRRPWARRNQKRSR
ncbi:MAG: MgtC/SapB family protein [Synechococcaceae cyanobacterium]|nr:MgtC/SapB family protein [Synechococcaceae cyanobacterium]